VIGARKNLKIKNLGEIKMKRQRILIGLLAIIVLLIVGCENGNVLSPTNKENLTSSNSSADFSQASDLYFSSPGAVYAMTNSTDGNEIVAFKRSRNGTLTFLGSYSTEGVGSGGTIDPLGSQGSVILGGAQGITSADKRLWLFAVNAGSNQISSFSLEDGKLDFRGIVASGGEFPVSLTVYGDLLYVLNATGAGVSKDMGSISGGNITGFRIGTDGRLNMIPKSTRPLSIPEDVDPAQIQFSPDGKLLVVTERITNVIDIYNVGIDGLAEGPIVHASVGKTPFGFSFDPKNQMIVSEASAENPNGSSASLYQLGPNGGINTLSPSVPTFQTAGCWTVVTGDGGLVFISNTLSQTITALEIQDNKLALVQDAGIAAETGENSFPIDLALSQDSHFLYVLKAGLGTIGAYKVLPDGNLDPVEISSGTTGYLPAHAGAQGLAAY
jgi:6-phosphogluconolactonase